MICVVLNRLMLWILFLNTSRADDVLTRCNGVYFSDNTGGRQVQFLRGLADVMPACDPSGTRVTGGLMQKKPSLTLAFSKSLKK